MSAAALHVYYHIHLPTIAIAAPILRRRRAISAISSSSASSVDRGGGERPQGSLAQMEALSILPTALLQRLQHHLSTLLLDCHASRLLPRMQAHQNVHPESVQPSS